MAADAYYSKAELMRRGWTPRDIQSFLGDCDKEQKNPYYKKAPPMRLWEKTRVEAIEQTEKFQDRPSLPRKKRARAAVETKRQTLLQYVQSMEIWIDLLESDVLFQRACNHYNNRKLEREEWGSSLATPTSEPRFLARICVNYLRHQCSGYELELSNIYGRVGTNEAYLILKTRILDEIANLYPYLATACAEQKERLHEPKIAAI